MKKALIMILVLMLCTALLVGCGRASAPTPTPAPTVTPVPTVTPAPVPMTEAEQRVFIEHNRNTWLPQELQYETWYYAITDLDHNGRLEVLTASLQGTGLYTWVKVWEMNESCTGLVQCPDNTREGEAWPDIIKETLTSWHDPVSGRWSYVCEDYLRDGAARYYTAQQSFCLDHGRVELNTLASMEEVYTDESHSTKNYFDANGAAAAEQDYNSAVQRAFAGQEQGTLTLSWTQLEPQTQPTSQPQLTQQPLVTAQPQISAQPQVTAQPQVGGPVTITKNPTSESLAVGGKTWFIAHASNASSLTWILTSPQGQSYSVAQAMQANPGLVLQELPDDTLGVSNVPVSVDGWSVQARFDGPGGTAVTAPAMIYVDDTLSAYGSVVSAYYYAYTNGITDPSYAWERGISEYFTYSQHVGYVLQDLNGDGVDELIIMGTGENNNSGNVLYEIDTLINGQPLQLACSSARNRYYLRIDGRIVNEGSNSAFNSAVFLYEVGSDGLIPVEGVITYFPGNEMDSCYYQSGHCDYEPWSNDEPITMEQYEASWDQYKSLCSVPPLTLIA